MNEGYVSRTAIAAAVAWLVVGAFMAGAWLLATLGAEMCYVVLMATTGCASSAVAATLHIKTYMARLGRLARALSGVERERTLSAVR